MEGLPGIFLSVGLKEAAREYNKMNRHVYTDPRHYFPEFRSYGTQYNQRLHIL
jgi:hypothetical protein